MENTNDKIKYLLINEYIKLYNDKLQQINNMYNLKMKEMEDKLIKINDQLDIIENIK